MKIDKNLARAVHLELKVTESREWTEIAMTLHWLCLINDGPIKTNEKGNGYKILMAHRTDH